MTFGGAGRLAYDLGSIQHAVSAARAQEIVGGALSTYLNDKGDLPRHLPGSRVPLYFAGARMVAMYGTGPVYDGMG